MSRIATRSWATLFLASALALSACSTNDTSGIRTRNSASIETCLNATLKATRVEITRNSCAAAIVEVSRVRYPDKVTTPQYQSRPADFRVSTILAIGIDHLGQPFDFAFEARNAANEPIEHIRVQGSGSDTSQFRVSYSTITPISDTESCIEVTANSSGLNLNGSCGADTENYYARAIVDRSSNDYIYNYYQTNIFPNRVTVYAPFVFGLTPNAEQYWSLISHRDGTPTNKMAVSRIGTSDLVVKYYSYSQPTIIQPYQVDAVAAATPTTTVGTTTSAGGVTTTVAINAPTTMPTDTVATTSSIVNTSTTDAPTTSTEAVATVLRSAEDACASLEGVTVGPDPQQWTESTRFRFSIANDCMTQSPFYDPYAYGVSHSLIAINKDNNERIRYESIGDLASGIYFDGRLYAGDWELILEQTAWLPRLSEDFQKVMSFQTLDVTVTTDPNGSLNLCDGSDVRWDGEVLSLDCDYGAASAEYLTPSNRVETLIFAPEEGVTFSPVPTGWFYASIRVSLDGLRRDLFVMLCATGCDVLPTQIAAKIDRFDTGIGITPQASACTQQATPYGVVGYLKKVNEKLMVHTPNAHVGAMASVFNSTGLSVISLNSNAQIPTDVDHILLAINVDNRSSTCKEQFKGSTFGMSIFPLPGEASTELATEDVAISLPARVDNVEFSRTDTIGTSVVVEKDQQFVEIPTSSFTLSQAAGGSPIASVSVLGADNEWVPVSGGLSTFVPITSDSLKVKYTFEDGTESVITKPIIAADEYQAAIEDSSGSSANTLVLALVVLAALIAAGAGAFFIRRRKA